MGNRRKKAVVSKDKEKAIVETDKKGKRKLVISLYVAGAILVLLGTSFFSYRIPQMDEDLSMVREEIEKLRLTSTWYLLGDISAKADAFEKVLLYEVNPQSKHLEAVDQHLRADDTMTLAFLHQILYGRNPARDKMAEWSKMNHVSLQEEKKKMLEKSSEKELDFNNGQWASLLPKRFEMLAGQLRTLEKKKESTLL